MCGHVRPYSCQKTRCGVDAAFMARPAYVPTPLLPTSTYFESGKCPATSLDEHTSCTTLIRADPGLCRVMYRELNLRILHRLIPNLSPIILGAITMLAASVHDRTSGDLDTLTIATLDYLELFLESPLLLRVLAEPLSHTLI